MKKNDAVAKTENLFVVCFFLVRCGVNASSLSLRTKKVPFGLNTEYRYSLLHSRVQTNKRPQFISFSLISNILLIDRERAFGRLDGSRLANPAELDTIREKSSHRVAGKATVSIITTLELALCVLRW